MARGDGRLPVFSYVSVEKTPAYLRAIEAIADLGREFHLQVCPEQVRERVLGSGATSELADEASTSTARSSAEQVSDGGSGVATESSAIG